MNEHDNHQFQSPDEYTPQVPHSLLPQVLAHLGLEEAPRTFDSSLESLGEGISHPEWMARAATIEALAHFSDRQSLGWLLSALHDDDESVRACAARVLGKRVDARDPVVIEQLETALRDPAWHVRETAVYALGMIGSFASVPALNVTMDDEDASVRFAVTQVIEHLESATHKEQQEQEKELPMLEEKQYVAEQNTLVASIAAETSDKRVSARPIRPLRPWLRVLEQAVAVLLILGIAISWFAISHLPRSSAGSPAVFNDTNARPLGAPKYTIQSNLSYLAQWSNDGHTFFALQVDTQKHTLQVRALNAISGHTISYPVLDSSWLAALGNFNIDMVGHYLLALRAQGNNLATLEIWDITGRRAITKQTVPASIGGNDQILAPLLVASDNNQQFAMLSPDGTITIWDIAKGQKLLTLHSKASYVRGIPPEIKWYNHDQNLLFFGRSNFPGSLQVWNTTTGTLLFSEHDASVRYSQPGIAPNGKYLALAANISNNPGSDTLEILDASSGQVLHTYKLQALGLGGASFTWLSDSRHLLLLYTPDHNSHLHGRVIDALTGQITGNFFSTYTAIGFEWFTPDARYLLLGSSDSSNSDSSSAMQIWQTSNGRLVATISTPGLHPNPYSYFGANNQYMLIGEKDAFDIWDIATGKLLYKYHGFTPFSVAGAGGSNVFWSPDRKYLTMIAWKTSLMGTGSDNGVISIWRMP